MDQSQAQEDGHLQAVEGGSRWRRPGAVAAFSALALLVGVFGVSLITAGRALPANPSGRRAPDFTLPLLDRAGSLSLSSIRGRPIVLNFWASW